jgi:hypothetical protein
MTLELEARHGASPVRWPVKLRFRAGMDSARFPDRNEPRAELRCDGGSENEAASFDSRHLGNASIVERFRERGSGAAEEAGIGEETERVGMAVEVAQPPPQLVPQLLHEVKRKGQAG